MRAEVVVQVFHLLGRFDLETHGEWVTGSCPFAWVKHGGGKDSNPSFGITVTEDSSESHYNCFSCGSHGKLSDLPVELAYWIQRDPSQSYPVGQLYQLLEENAPTGYTMAPPYEEVKYAKKLLPFPEKWLDTFPSAQKVPAALKYLLGRHVPMWQIAYFDLRYDVAKNAIVMPLRTKDGVLAGARARMISPEAKSRFYDYSHGQTSNTQIVLYNENHLDYSKTVILVEGNFDVMAVARHYPNVVSAQTTKLSPKQRETLIYAPDVLCMFDNDKAGTQGFLDLKKHLAKDVYIARLEFPNDYKDPDEMPDAELRETLSKYVDIEAN